MTHNSQLTLKAQFKLIFLSFFCFISFMTRAFPQCTQDTFPFIIEETPLINNWDYTWHAHHKKQIAMLKIDFSQNSTLTLSSFNFRVSFNKSAFNAHNSQRFDGFRPYISGETTESQYQIIFLGEEGIGMNIDNFLQAPKNGIIIIKSVEMYPVYYKGYYQKFYDSKTKKLMTPGKIMTNQLSGVFHFQFNFFNPMDSIPNIIVTEKNPWDLSPSKIKYVSKKSMP